MEKIKKKFLIDSKKKKKIKLKIQENVVRINCKIKYNGKM